MIKLLNGFTYLNISGRNNKFNKKYLQPLSIILSHRLKLKRKGNFEQINIGLSDNLLPSSFSLEHNSKNRISIYTNFDYKQFNLLEKDYKIKYLLTFLIQILLKVHKEDSRVQVQNLLSFENEFKQNANTYLIDIIEKNNALFNIQIGVVLKFNEFIYTCLIKDNVKNISYSVILIRIKPDLIRLNNFHGKVKILQNSIVKYYCNEVIFRIDILKGEFYIESRSSFDSLKKYISHNSNNWDEVRFLLEKVK